MAARDGEASAEAIVVSRCVSDTRPDLRSPTLRRGPKRPGRTVADVIDDLAHHPDPYPAYARLRRQGTHQIADGRWVVSGSADVAAVLAGDVAVGYRPSPDVPGSRLQARMARFSDGEDHDRRREVAVAQLASLDPAALRARARELARERLYGSVSVEVMSRLARHVPVATLAESLGADRKAEDVDAAVAETRKLALAIAPPVGGVRGDPTEHLARLAHIIGLHPPGGRPPDTAVNVVGLLFQAVDAAAGLIGNGVVAAHRFGLGLRPHSEAATCASTDIGSNLVEETSRFDPPVQLTTRVATERLDVGGAAIPKGARIVVLLAAASRDPAFVERPDDFDLTRPYRSLTFGAGPRSCPGAEHARALAAGVIDALRAAHAVLSEPVIGYERRPNLRIPSRLGVRLGGGA